MASRRWLPTAPEVSREAVAVVLGALIGALFVSQFPRLKAWLRENYSSPPGV